MEMDWHTLLDLLTLIATVWVIVTMTVQLKNSYQREKDTTPEWIIVRWWSWGLGAPPIHWQH